MGQSSRSKHTPHHHCGLTVQRCSTSRVPFLRSLNHRTQIALPPSALPIGIAAADRVGMHALDGGWTEETPIRAVVQAQQQASQPRSSFCSLRRCRDGVIPCTLCCRDESGDFFRVLGGDDVLVIKLRVVGATQSRRDVCESVEK